MNTLQRISWAAMGCIVALGSGSQSAPAVKIVRPEMGSWSTPPNIPDITSFWVLGAEGETGPYAIRVRLKAGGRIPVHTHPDQRYSTVLSGTLYVGFGSTVNDAQFVAVPAGAVAVTPANVPHYLWAKDGPVEYQEAGVGPTATRMVAPATTP